MITTLSATLALTLGAFVANVTPTETAKADTTDKYFEMSYGAQVSLSKKYSGIRFTAVVSDSWYAEQTQNGATVELGMLIAPYTGAELVYENAEALGASVIVNQTEVVFDENGEYTYTGAIRYDDILADYREAYPTSTATDEQILASAYKMELSARAYAIVTAEDGTKGEPVYATSNNNVRSARQVANSALLKGDIQKNLSSGLYTEDDIPMLEARLNGYIVGAKERSNVSVDYDLSVSEAQTVDFAGLKGEIEEVLIDGQKVDATVNGTKVTLNAISGFSAGEHYLSAFDKDGNVYSQKIILATKIIKTASELASLQSYVDVTTGTNSASKTYYSYGGYFVLGGNITATGTEAAFTASSVGSISSGGHMISEYGFHGIFDGRGYTVDGFTYGIGGVFGDIGDNAVIKNVAFTNCTAVKVGGSGSDKDNGSGVLSANARGSFLVSNVYVEGQMTGNNAGILFGRSSANGRVEDTVVVTKSINAWKTGALSGWRVGDMTFDNVTIVYDSTSDIRTLKAYGDNPTMYTNVTEYQEQSDGTIKNILSKTANETYTATVTLAETAATLADFEDYDSKYWTVVDGYAPVYNQYTEDGKKIVDLTAYKTVDLVVKDTTATVGEQIATGVNGLVGAINVNAVYENNTTTDVKDNVGSAVGFLQTADTATTEAARTKTMLVYTADAVYKVKAVVITKVITTASELANLIDYASSKTTVSTTYSNVTRETYSYNGYFVLGNSLTYSATDENNNVTFAGPTLGTANNQKVMSIASLKQIKQDGSEGFHGVFDGRGYTIDGFTYDIGGIFGVLGSNAVVKNVAFTNCTVGDNENSVDRQEAVLAQFAWGSEANPWKIENVYMQGTMNGATSGMMLGYYTEYGQFSNVVTKTQSNGSCDRLGAIAFQTRAHITMDNVTCVYLKSSAGRNYYEHKAFGVLDNNALNLAAKIAEYDMTDGTAKKIVGKTIYNTNYYSAIELGDTATVADFAKYDSAYWTVTAGYAPVFKTK